MKSLCAAAGVYALYDSPERMCVAFRVCVALITEARHSASFLRSTRLQIESLRCLRLRFSLCFCFVGDGLTECVLCSEGDKYSSR